MDYKRLGEALEPAYESAEKGLPEEVFSYVSSVTPMINVDLLLQSKSRGILLAWREDEKGSGWHIPGGIIRYKESAGKRIEETAKRELGCTVSYDATPLKISEIILPERKRGHFISLLYRCHLPDNYEVALFNRDKKERDDGFLKWHASTPREIVYGQKEAYGAYLKEVMIECLSKG